MEQIKEYNLTTIREQLPAIIDDFTKYYIFYHKNPEYAEYQRLYENIKGNMDNLESQVAKMSQSIDQQMELLGKQMKTVNVKIDLEKIRNKRLKRQLGSATNASNGAEEMVVDYTTIYREGYIRNWTLAFGVFGLAVFAANQIRAVQK